jgi:branched-chain amino acid transport system permease protein
VDYLLRIGVLVEIYAVLAVSLDLIAGHTGQVSLAHAAFYGIGAYTSAIMTIHLGVPFGCALLLSFVTAGLTSFIISLPALRLLGDYFVMATFGFQMVVFSVLNNWSSVTNGPLGIAGIPEPTILGVQVDSSAKFFVLAGFILLVSWLLVNRIVESPFGRVLHAVREDEVFARSMGKDTVRFKVIAFGLGCALAGAAGSLYAHYVAYVDPNTFSAMDSIMILSMVIIGGASSRWGSIIGAIIIACIPEALRFLGLPGAIASNLRQIIYGGLLVAVILSRPRGLFGQYGFER